MRYYQPESDEFVLENVWDRPFELIALCQLLPGERRTFKTADINKPGNIRLYLDDDDFVHIGCVGFAVEVDGKRYEWIRKDRSPKDLRLFGPDDSYARKISDCPRLEMEHCVK